MKKRVLIIVAALICLWLLWVWFALGNDAASNQPDQSMNDSANLEITSFEECVAAGNPVAESFPEQCFTPDGERFVNTKVNAPE